MKRYKAKSAKGKGPWGEIQRKMGRTSKSPLLESHRTCLISPAVNCDNILMCCLPGKLARDLLTRIFIGGWSCRHLLLPCTRIPNSGRKAVVQHKSHCFYKQFRRNEPFLLGNDRNLLKSKGQPYKETFERITVSGLCWLFYVHSISLFMIKANNFYSGIIVQIKNSEYEAPSIIPDC